MKEALAYLSIILLIASCNSDKQSASDEMPPLFPPPITVKLNTEEGYFINPVTGDSIHPIVNSLGDTLKTGVPVPARGKVIPPESVAQPGITAAGEPEVIPTKLNVHKIPEGLTIIPVNTDSLKTFTPGVDTSSFVLVNSFGDTVPTGVPIPIKGKVVPCIQPQPVKALPFRMKDNANMNMKYLDVDQGMNSSFIFSSLEDSHGNLWFGTEGEGVSMYNGQTFTHYTEKEGLSNNTVRSMLEDSHGNLWFGTRFGGVSMYNGESFTHFTERQGLGINDVRSILEDSHGNLWFGTESVGGMCMFNGETFTHFTVREGLSNNRVVSILEDRHGNLWFGTKGGGVSMYDGETFTHFSIKEGLSDSWVWSMLEDSHGNLWFGTPNGVNMYNGESITHFTEKEGLCDDFIWSILEDSHGNLWFGTIGGVSMYNGEYFTHLTEKEGLSNNIVMSIIEDSQDNLWFGTWGGGVSIYKDESFTHVTKNEGLSDINVKAVVEDRHGNLWLSTQGGGMSMFNGVSFSHFAQKRGSYDIITRAILDDSQGYLWLGTLNFGVRMYNGETFTHFTTKEGLIDDNVRSISEDSHGNIWFGTVGGVSAYNGTSFTNFTQENGLINNHVRAILEDRYGNLWFGTIDGVSMYNGESFTHFTEKEGLSNNEIWSIMEDSHGNIWFGTNGGGASMYNGESFTHFTQKEGLSNNSVTSILEGSNGNIWIGTHKDLNCIVFGQESVSGKENSLPASGVDPVIYTYNEQDGLKGKGFTSKSVLLDSKNRIWWGCDKSLTMLDLNNFKIPVEPPANMQLDRIDINDQYADYRNLEDSVLMKIEFDSIPRFSNYPLNLKLPHNLNHLTFYYSAIDWSAPHKIRYSYKMEGLKENWSTPTAENNADYRNLPQGTFTFKVRAIGSAQKWSDPFEYTFKIKPPWWFSWWAYIIYGFIILIIIRQYRRYLLNRAKLQTEVEIERMEKEKLEELDHMRSRFFANISHEFRTPLTLLLGPLEDGLKIRKSIIETDRGVFEMMRRNTKRLQRLINQLLDLSKLETGKIKLQVSEGNLTDFVRTIVLSFLSLAESKKIKYEYELSELPGPVFFDQDKLEKILTNLVSNAFKFTSPEGNIKITLNYIIEEEKDTPAFSEFSIIDTGHGIPADQIEKIFDRFYQADSSESNAHEGTGIGLALTKEMVDLYRGEIHVESEIGKGSTFTVKLPVAKALFKEDEIAEVVTGKEPAPIEEIIDTAEPERREFPEADTRVNEDLPTILIVEDNADLRKYISQSLINEFQILKAENGREGMSKAFEDIPDLVITDLMMPEMDGMEMCERIKNDERTSHIPVIMLTAKADRDSKLEGLKTGADDYLIKPFDAEELRVRTRNLIEQRRKLREKFRKEFRIKPLEETLRVPGDNLLRKVLDILSQNMGDPQYNVDRLPGKLNMSRSQMFRKIGALTGGGPKELLRIMRLKKAAELILIGKLNITSIMYEVGFQNPSHFAQSFRDYFGVNPSQYQKSGNT